MYLYITDNSIKFLPQKFSIIKYHQLSQIINKFKFAKNLEYTPYFIKTTYNNANQ